MAENIELATAYVNLVSSAKGLGQQIVSDTSGAADKAGSAAGAAYGGALLSAAKKIAAPAAIAATLKGFYNVGRTFDDVADTIRVGTGTTGAALNGLVGIAKTVGTKVPADFSKVGSTVADLNTRMGLSGKNLETVASQYLEAGRILNQDVDIQSTTAAFSAFGIQGEAVSGAMDDLFRVSQATGVGMNELAKAAQVQAPVMKNLGFSFKDTASLVGSLDKAGLNSTQIMASMSRAMVNLAKDGKEPKQAFKDVTSEITSLVNQGKTAEAINLAGKVFGTRGATQFIGAVQAGTLSVEDLMAATGATGDTILDVSKETADMAESWKLVKNKALAAIEPVGSALFSVIGKGMGFVADRMDGWIKVAEQVGAKSAAGIRQAWNAAMTGKWESGPFQANGAVAKGMLALNTAGAKAASSFKSQVVPAFSETGKILNDSLGKAFASLGPVIGQLVPTFTTLLSAFSPVGTVFKAFLPVLPELSSIIGKLVEVIAGGLAAAFTAIQPLLETLAGVVTTVTGLLSDLIVSLMPPLIDLFNQIIPVVQGVFDVLVPLVSQIANALIPVINYLMPVIKSVFGFIGQYIGIVVDNVKNVIQLAMNVITGNWGAAWDNIKNIFGNVWDAIKLVVSTAVDYVKGVLSGAWNIITSVARGAWEGIKHAIVQPLQAAWDWITGVFGKIGDWFSELWTGIVNTAGRILGGIGGAARSAFEGIVDFIKKPLNGIINFINSTIIWGINKLIDGANGLIRWLPGISYLPHLSGIPNLAKGGIVEPEVGGKIVRVAEAGQREIVTPEPLMRSIVVNAIQNSGRNGPLIGNVSVTHPIDEARLAMELDRRLVFAGGV